MGGRITGKSHFNDLRALVDHLTELRDRGGWVHQIAPSGDAFELSYSDARGDRLRLDFSLPPVETEFVTGALAAGYLGAHAVNSGSLRQVLSNFALRLPPQGGHPELSIGHVGGS
jgi:hypothetical protein